MTREEIIAMAREAQTYHATDTWAYSLAPNQLERFAALIAAHEREECAKACEEYAFHEEKYFPDDPSSWVSAKECAAIIRARSETC